MDTIEGAEVENPTYIALSRLMAQERTMDVIANNIANTNTPGFKAGHMLFSDWLLPAPHASGSGAAGTIAFAQDRSPWQDLSSGSITHTGEPLDLAIGRTGYFSVSTPSGVRLTRSGRFALQGDGTVVDSAGNALLDDAGSPIVLTSADDDVTVAGDGTVSSARGQIGKIGIVSPSDPNRLVPEGSHLFRSDVPTSPVGSPGIIQGGIEDSNVSAIAEMTEMMQLGRDFQFVAQFAQSEADRQQSAIDKLSAEPTA